MVCARLEEIWLSAERDAAGVFDVSRRATIAGVSMAFTAP
jgi:hypothetical protein